MQPVFTVSAAVLISDGHGRVLLLDHVLRPFSGWGLPGGFVHHGEQPFDAIRREVREEVALELADLSLARVRTIGRHVEVLFTAVAEGVPQINSREIIAFGWFSPDELNEKVSLALREVISDIFRNETIS